MKKILFFSLIIFYMSDIFAQNVEHFGKFETDVNISINYENPFDYDEIAVTAVFTAPNGEQKEVDGFFIDRYEVSNAQYKKFVEEDGYSQEKYWRSFRRRRRL